MKKLIITSFFVGALMLSVGASKGEAVWCGGQPQLPCNPVPVQLPCSGAQQLPGCCGGQVQIPCCGCQALPGGCGSMGSSSVVNTNVNVSNTNVLVGTQSVYSKNNTGGNVSMGNFGGSIVTGNASLTNSMTISGNTNTTVIEINN